MNHTEEENGAPERGRPGRKPGSGRTAAVPSAEEMARLQRETEAAEAEENARLAVPRIRTESVARDTIREPARDGVRRRNRRSDQQVSAFDIPERYKKPGLSYEWKRHTAFGQENEVYTGSLLENGWLPVDAKEMVGFSNARNGAIIREGMILMERPQELTDQARQEMQMDARNVMVTQAKKVQSTPDNTFDRRHPQVNNFMKSEFASSVHVDRNSGEPIPVTDD